LIRRLPTAAVSLHEDPTDIAHRLGDRGLLPTLSRIDLVMPLPGWTAADDFGFYSEKRPSVYFRLGIRSEEAGSVYPLHHPQFRIDESAMALGTAVLVQAALRFIGRSIT